MASGHVELAAYLQRLRSLPTLAERAAPEVAAALESEMTAQIARGEDPSGRKWKRTLQWGRRSSSPEGTFGASADHAGYVHDREPFAPVEGGELVEPLATEARQILERYVLEGEV